MTKNIILAFLLLTQTVFAQTATKYTISGYVKEKGSKELLVGVPIYIPELKNGTTTNQFGFYSITFSSPDSISMIISYMGYNPVALRLKPDKSISLNIELSPDTKLMKEVEIVADQKDKESQSTQMSAIHIPVQQIKDIPALLGEKDVLKVLQLMPGVQKGGEGSSGFYVRGGGADQNLIILDDAPVYNVSHLFGFFSVFNGDALKSVELIKGGFPARYGGRLSSVLDMRMKEGNKEKIQVECGIGLISSRLTVEGPIVKDKSSFLFSGRRTYIDLLAAPFIAAYGDGLTGGYYFYDYNAKFNYDFGENNRMFVSGYFGHDKFYFKDKEAGSQTAATLAWGNATATVRWNHLFNDKLFSNTSVIASDYKFLTKEDDNFDSIPANLKYSSGIRDYGIKYDMDYRPTMKHYIRTGFTSTYHLFTIQALTLVGGAGSNNINNKNTAVGIESGIYAEDNYKISSTLKSNFGVRLSHFNTHGKNYIKPEPRISLSYNIKEDLAVKVSYAEMNQYLHLISNSSIGLPTDLWVPAAKNVSPQYSMQVAAGVVKDFLTQKLSVSVEGYYKNMDHVLAFKEGAGFLQGDGLDEGDTSSLNWEKKVTAGKAWSYGAEFLVQRKFGKLSGWIGYTLSWTQMQFDSLNFGKKFYAKYDRRHDISIVGIYHLREENTSSNKGGITLSCTWVYGTGNAITLPVSLYNAPNNYPFYNTSTQSDFSTYSEYSGKNAYRMAPYHRLDLGIQFHKTKRHGIRTWEFSIYNVYNRHNPYFYYIGRGNQLRQISLFPILPSFSYSFNFITTLKKKTD